MESFDQITENLLKIIDGKDFSQTGAFSVRQNGTVLCHGDSEHVKIKPKKDQQGMDVWIDGNAKGEIIHVPVVVAVSGLNDVVYNDFYVSPGADVTIISGCGIHNSGCNESRHDGIHSFHVGEGAVVRYEEKHYGEGEGTGTRVLNPLTNIYLEKNSTFIMDTTQIKGVDSTLRETHIELGENARLQILEKLMTHGEQKAVSNMDVELNGTDSSAQIISRSVAKGHSVQTFHPKAIGQALCHAHIQCDSIIMDQAEVCSIPEINARHLDAAIIHEAAIGRINDEQLIKLRTLGMTSEEAETVIIENFLGE
jgi:Fe-S cluster assembly scaffold protein SufB